MMPQATIKLPDSWRVVWQPIPNSSQELAITAPCDEILFTGSRGPGKTDTQLMRFLRNVNVGYGRFWRGVIFDREYKNLDDLVAKSKRWFPQFKNGAKFYAGKGDYKWSWPTGEELLFRVAFDADDYMDYHGQEFPFIGWNELCKQPTSDVYDMMLSLNRSSFTSEKDTPDVPLPDKKGNFVHNKAQGKLVPPIPLECFSTTNSYGPGHAWVKRRFILPAPYGQAVRVKHKVFNPATKVDEIIERTQVTYFGSWRENVFLDPKYIANLKAEKNKERRKSWLQGSWDVVAGGAFDDLWSTSRHIIPRFPIPKSWRMDRALDWGSSTPFCVIWFAEANGEDVELPDGTMWAPVAGSLIQFAEWYGSEEVGTNVGMRLSPKQLAEGVNYIETKLLELGWVIERPMPGPADNQITQTTRIDIDTIAKEMEAAGVYWEPSDKSPGSRSAGFELFRSRLANTLSGEGPGVYVMDNCKVTLEIIPTLPRSPKNPDDVDTTAEDHVWDVWRYRTLKGNNRWATSKDIQIKFAL